MLEGRAALSLQRHGRGRMHGCGAGPAFSRGCGRPGGMARPAPGGSDAPGAPGGAARAATLLTDPDGGRARTSARPPAPAPAGAAGAAAVGSSARQSHTRPERTPTASSANQRAPRSPHGTASGSDHATCARAGQGRACESRPAARLGPGRTAAPLRRGRRLRISPSGARARAATCTAPRGAAAHAAGRPRPAGSGSRLIDRDTARVQLRQRAARQGTGKPGRTKVRVGYGFLTHNPILAGAAGYRACSAVITSTRASYAAVLSGCAECGRALARAAGTAAARERFAPVEAARAPAGVGDGVLSARSSKRAWPVTMPTGCRLDARSIRRERAPGCTTCPRGACFWGRGLGASSYLNAVGRTWRGTQCAASLAAGSARTAQRRSPYSTWVTLQLCVQFLSCTGASQRASTAA